SRRWSTRARSRRAWPFTLSAISMVSAIRRDAFPSSTTHPPIHRIASELILARSAVLHSDVSPPRGGRGALLLVWLRAFCTAGHAGAGPGVGGLARALGPVGPPGLAGLDRDRGEVGVSRGVGMI